MPSGAASVPDQARHRPKWQLALDMLDELAGWELVPPVVLADAAYGEVSELRLGLDQRELAYVVQVPGTISAYPADVAPQTVPYAGRGRPPLPRYRQPRSSLRALVGAAGARAATTVTWREGADGNALVSRFVAVRMRPAGVKLRRATQGGELPVRWLLAQWPQGPTSRSSTGWPICPPTPRWSGWWAWPSCAGEWSTTIARSRTRSVWTISRGAPSRAGTTT